MTADLPTLDKISSTSTKGKSLSDKDRKGFMLLLKDFFWFYGEIYQKKNHLISAYTHSWLSIKKDPSQKSPPPDQKS